MTKSMSMLQRDNRVKPENFDRWMNLLSQEERSRYWGELGGKLAESVNESLDELFDTFKWMITELPGMISDVCEKIALMIGTIDGSRLLPAPAPSPLDTSAQKDR